MNWIFQAVPKRYDLQAKLVVDDTETWLVSRYREEIGSGDNVFFWLAGNPAMRGLHGRGQVVSNKVEYFPDWGHGMEVRYTEKFDPHIPYNAVAELSSMVRHPIITMPIGTNFRLADKQAREIEGLILSF